MVCLQNYVHRSGRTARASQEGLSVILVSPDEVKLYKNILKLKQGEAHHSQFDNS